MRSRLVLDQLIPGIEFILIDEMSSELDFLLHGQPLVMLDILSRTFHEFLGFFQLDSSFFQLLS